MKNQKRKSNIAIIGGGSWATAIAKILSTNQHNVHWWLRSKETVDHIRNFGHNPKYLSSVQFDNPINNITTNINEAVEGAELIIWAVPSYYFTETIRHLKPEELQGKKNASAIKGITQHEHYTITQYLHKQYHIPQEHLASITGPCHAEEVAAEKLSYLTFSSPDIEFANEIASIFENRFMQTATCTDMVGTEYASVIKNIFAIAAGISVGLGYGDNFRAVLVSKAMQEMQYFLDEVDPGHRNILAPAYLGDTLVTAYSPYSRNRTFGLMIGKGYTINAAILELNMVAEGYYASKAIKAIAKEHKLEMPIADAIHNILYGKIAPAIEFRVLTGKLI